MSFLFYKTILRALFLGMQPIYIGESGFQLFNNKYYRWRKREEDFPYGSVVSFMIPFTFTIYV